MRNALDTPIQTSEMGEEDKISELIGNRDLNASQNSGSVRIQRPCVQSLSSSGLATRSSNKSGGSLGNKTLSKSKHIKDLDSDAKSSSQESKVEI